MIRRRVYDVEHEEFRQAFRGFVDRELTPHLDEWEAAKGVPRELFARAAEAGFVGFAVPEEYGGLGLDDFRYNAVIAEEIGASGVAGAALGIATHNDIVLPYFLALADDAQRARWFPGLAAGELITAVAMTEPGAGSDLAGIRTTAERDGDDWIVTGSKTFISNGINADLVVTAVRTDAGDAHGGLTLIVIERDMPGFTRGTPLHKLGLHAQDTAELFFDQVRVPVANTLGEIGGGFRSLTAKLAQERLGIAIEALAVARQAVVGTVEYVRERTAFGRPIGQFQNSRFQLAELQTEVDVTQSFIDDCIRAHLAGELSAAEAAEAKWWASELQGRTVDRCLQLFGGYGYMSEYPIAKAFIDSRITRIYGGTTEILKQVVAKGMGL
ncbi:acyl-CoA dehydrogenase family protein [Microbacterium gorillae]|uniref:acyl-CoA dehydrogenase family protein n=1 Tax=Microbacterium gorillae TaxID=1231063 RepID=UPI000A929844|nr:acyl-CoA dehydrogenase family protein [Microbacterium gorillae]